MGFLLVRERLVEPEELREALRLQISRIVYTAFRWPDGRFRFSQEGTVDYDADHMAPVSTDTVLMEAAQMVDEWPMLEKKVGALTAVYRRAPGVETLNARHGREERAGGHAFGLAVRGGDVALDRRPAQRRRHHGARVPLGLRGPQGDRGSARPPSHRARARAGGGAASSRRDPAARRRGRRARRGRAIGALGGPRRCSRGLSRLPDPAQSGQRASCGRRGRCARRPSSRRRSRSNRAVSIERAVRIYYDSSGRYPRSLEDLVVAGILERGRPARSVRPAPTATSCAPRTGSSGSTGATRAGQIDLDLSLERSLAPVSELRPAPSRAPAQTERPSVLVVE